VEKRIAKKFPGAGSSVIILLFRDYSPSEKMRSQKGQTVVEFSLVVLLFFMLFFAIVEFSHLFYTQLTLQHALREAGRYMVTGRADVPDLSTSDPNDKLPRPQSIEAILKQQLIGTGAGLQSIAMTCGGAACSPAGGGPGDTVKVTVTFTKPWFTGLFGGNPITFTLSTTWKNEPSFS
jgi:Flp pilus assembly protein TadG